MKRIKVWKKKHKFESNKNYHKITGKYIPV